jgi:hypothetical protein
MSVGIDLIFLKRIKMKSQLQQILGVDLIFFKAKIKIE